MPFLEYLSTSQPTILFLCVLFRSLQLELQSQGKGLLCASIHLTLRLLWGICLLLFLLPRLWLDTCLCFTLTKASLFHKLLCSEALASLCSSTLPCKYLRFCSIWCLSLLFLQFNLLPCAYGLNNWDEFSTTPSNGKAPWSIVLLGELKYQELMVAKSRVKVIGSFLYCSIFSMVNCLVCLIK